jgi:hypothetical protein
MKQRKDLHTDKRSDGIRDSKAEHSAAWEEIEAGRFKPRRIRGSCRGRELG